MSARTLSRCLVIASLAGCDWSVLVGTSPDGLARADAGATADVAMDAPADLGAEVTTFDVPMAPDLPAMIDVPTTPDLPAVIDVPTTPDLPAVIDVPATPDLGTDTGCSSPRLVCPGGGCVDLASDPDNCGACGVSCPNIHSTPTCTAGACELRCAGGFGDCDANRGNGCEVDLTRDPSNCGACGNTCPSGSCALGACSAPDAGSGCGSTNVDCDHNAANGCETNLLTDPANCGACGSVCPAGQSCVVGVCR